MIARLGNGDFEVTGAILLSFRGDCSGDRV